MAKPLEINIAANTREAVSGVENFADALEEVSDALHDAAGDGDKLERSVSENMRDIQQDSRRAGNAIGDDIKDGTRRASRGMDDFRDESKQSLRETAASVRDVSDGLDAVQEIAANALIGFGPVGLAAGLTAAAGIGFVSAALEDAQQAADETKARIRSLYQEAAEDGRAFLDEAQINAEALNIIYDENQTRYQTAMKDAANLGLPWIETVRAMAGDQEALNNVLTRTNELEEARNEKIENAKGPLELRGALMTSEGQTLDEINGRYTAQNDLIKQNAQVTEAWLATQQKSTEEIQKANKALAETPKTVPVALTVDDSALKNSLKAQIVRVTVDAYTRNGHRIV